MSFKQKPPSGSIASSITFHKEPQSVEALRIPVEILPVATERVPLIEAVGRVLAKDIYARFDSPSFDESMRDGYAIGPFAAGERNGEATFTLVGASGAGDSLDIALNAGEAWKVMTGGKVPAHCSHVIPNEWCQVSGGSVIVGADRLVGPSFICRKGDVHSKKEQLLAGNEVVTPAMLLRIANAGYSEIEVYIKPKVCFCCTGKELVVAGSVVQGSEKISSNQYVLNALLGQYGCSSTNYGIVGDEEQLVVDFFAHSLVENYDLVVTTGGTGGGDFDLVEGSFIKAGGTVVCTNIDMRPGKSTIVGYKGHTVYVGLPGPPAAVHTVFLELVVPIIMKMRGVKKPCPTPLSAVAGEDIRVKSGPGLLVKEGILHCIDGVLIVRTAKKNELATCNMLISEGKDCLLKGEIVEVHLREPLC